MHGTIQKYLPEDLKYEVLIEELHTVYNLKEKNIADVQKYHIGDRVVLGNLKNAQAQFNG